MLNIDFESGFEELSIYLEDIGANKWPVITLFGSHYNEYEDVFIKPTTIKGIAKILEIDIDYKSKPNIITYNKVKDMIFEYKKNSKISKDLSNILTQAILYNVYDYFKIKI